LRELPGEQRTHERDVGVDLVGMHLGRDHCPIITERGTASYSFRQTLLGRTRDRESRVDGRVDEAHVVCHEGAHLVAKDEGGREVDRVQRGERRRVERSRELPHLGRQVDEHQPGRQLIGIGLHVDSPRGSAQLDVGHDARHDALASP
jgi:hypothetical protein